MLHLLSKLAPATLSAGARRKADEKVAKALAKVSPFGSLVATISIARRLQHLAVYISATQPLQAEKLQQKKVKKEAELVKREADLAAKRQKKEADLAAKRLKEEQKKRKSGEQCRRCFRHLLPRGRPGSAGR